MYNTHTKKSTKFAGKKGAKNRGLKAGNYADYWMDTQWMGQNTRFSGLTETKQSSDLVKLVKLTNYRRAITNFVKIVTQKEIPVKWHGSTSYTNGKSITLSTDIKDNNFDVTVGLALHEASHIILSDFTLLEELMRGNVAEVFDIIAMWTAVDPTLFDEFHAGVSVRAILYYIKNLLNWIEDRRIDNYIFTTSPGYKAYYHKLYQYYWNDPMIATAIQSAKYRKVTFANYEFHITNMISDSYDSSALPGLAKIAGMIDIKNISRLTSTKDSLDLALEVFKAIIEAVHNNKPKATLEIEKEKDENTTPKPKSKAANPSPSDDQSDEDQLDEEQSDNETAEEQSDETGTDGSGAGDSGDNNDEVDDVQGSVEEANEGTELTPAQEKAIEKAIQKQQKFLSGQAEKKDATKQLQKKLDTVAATDIEVQQVGSGQFFTNSLIVDLTNSSKVQQYISFDDSREAMAQKYDKARKAATTQQEWNAIEADYQSENAELNIIRSAYDSYIPRSTRKDLEKAVASGFDMGGLLGKKLQLHNESRERVDVRLTTGKIDAKRLAHAGYGIDSIFKQVNIQRHKKANLHISLDQSGSMSGEKWISTIQMTAAIVKAISYTQNIEVQVSLRTSISGRSIDTPLILMAYDSRKNNLEHFRTIFSRVTSDNTTPEGLAFEAMMKKNLLYKGTQAMDSYFINISDGLPWAGDRYEGAPAVNHTAGIINKMRTSMNIQVLSFFVDRYSSSSDLSPTENYNRLQEQFNNSHNGRQFKQMYGKSAAAVDTSSAMHIAKEMNKKLMEQ